MLSRLDVARVAKPHGLRGEVIVELLTNRPERVKPGTVLYRGDEALQLVSAKPHQHRWIMRLSGIDTRDKADALRGEVLQAEPLDDPDALWVHELIGASVISDDSIDRGVVRSVLDNPAGDILELDSGALVPLRFVASFADGIVRVETPEGLFDLS